MRPDRRPRTSSSSGSHLPATDAGRPAAADAANTPRATEASSSSGIHRPAAATTPAPAAPARHTPPQHHAPPHAASSQSIHSTEVPVAERVTHPTLQSLRRNLSPSEFNTAMVHFYRGEVQRSNAWRNRLDTTTNWAVITAGATLSFAFSAPSNPHFVILINSLLVAFFLFMEGRRYRYYEIWSSRVRMLETDYFARMLAPDATLNEDWAVHLANDLLTPHFTISESEAVGRRLRRNYLWIFILLAASWNLKVYLHPSPARDFDEFVERAAVGLVQGEVIISVGVIFNVLLVVFALATVRLREAKGEVLPRHQFSLRHVTNWTRAATLERRTATVRRAKRARARARSRFAGHAAHAGSTTGEFKRIELDPEEESATRV